MKIFLLVMLTLLFFNRIKNTILVLKYSVWKNKLTRNLEEINDTIKEIKINSIKEFGTTIVWEVTKGFIYIFIILLYVLMIVTYAFVGIKIDNTYLLIMSAIQIILTLYGMKISFGNELFSTNIEDYKFHRIYNFINVIVDYMYYPVAIWMLLV